MSAGEVLRGVFELACCLLAVASLVGAIASVTTWAVMAVEDAVLTARGAIERVRHEGQD